MKRLAALALSVLLVVGGGIAVFWPVNFWRLFDDNLRPLALTQAENYCAGLHGIQNRFAFNDPEVIACIASSTYDNESPSIADSVRWGCQGIVAGGWDDGTTNDCVSIFDRDQLWLVKDGGITYAWSDAYPRPVAVGDGIIAPPDYSRTGTRDGFSRDDEPPPTTTGDQE
jgi:hypothetical protein